MFQCPTSGEEKKRKRRNITVSHAKVIFLVAQNEGL